MASEVSKSKKSAYNIIFSVGSQILLVAIGFLLPRLFITTYGSETNGFLSSISQVLTYVVLLELGIGTASLQALYKPVATGDRDKISGIMSATSRFYTRTGLLYLACVVVLAVVYPLVVPSGIPVWQQIAVILIVGGSGSVGYFFHAKYRILFNADGKQYIYTNAYTVIQVATNVVKIVLILLGQNIVLIQLGHLILLLLMAFYIEGYVKKHYPWLDLRVAPDKQAISQKNNVIVHELSQMIFNHTDVLLLTFFVDLKAVSVYVTYNMIVDIISTLISNVHNGFLFRLGQLFNVDKERYRQVYDTYETGYMLLSSVLYCVTFLFLTPFMTLYTKGVTDANYLDKWLPLLFVAIKLLVTGRAVAGNTISFAQHFKQTQWRAILEMGINLVTSVVGVIFFGIYGVLFGTLAALLYRANDMIIYANRRVMGQSSRRTYLRWVVDLGTFALAVFLSRFLPVASGGYLELIWKAAVYTAAVSLLYFLSNSIFFPQQMKAILQHVGRLLKKRMKRKEPST